MNMTDITNFSDLQKASAVIVTWILGYILELEHPRKTAKIPQIFSDFYYE